MECNSEISTTDIYDQLNDLLYKITKSHLVKYLDSNQIKIKGQIYKDATADVLSKIPNNVVLLGRYAEWNKRVTWDKVLKKLYEMPLID